MHRIIAAAVILALLVGCSSEPDVSGSTTSAPGSTTTLPPSPTTTTIPRRAVIAVDVCELVGRPALEAVLDDPGQGEAPEVPPPLPDVSIPTLVTAECSWPSIDDAQLVLSYLAPTTAVDGPQHLRDVLAVGTGFAAGGRVLEPMEVGAEVVGVLVDAEDNIREVATKAGTALIHLVVGYDVNARDTEALDALTQIVVTAVSRAPR